MANINKRYQINKLKQSLKRTKNAIERDRIRIVLGAYETSIRKTGKQQGIKRGKVWHWKHRYEKFGIKGLKPRKPPGRKCAIKEKDLVKIKHEIKSKDYRNGWKVKQLKQFIYKQSGVNYTEGHVVRIANKWGLSMITPRQEFAHKDKIGEKAFKKKPENY